MFLDVGVYNNGAVARGVMPGFSLKDFSGELEFAPLCSCASFRITVVNSQSILIRLHIYRVRFYHTDLPLRQCFIVPLGPLRQASTRASWLPRDHVFDPQDYLY